MIVTCFGFKGGQAKTTTAVHVAGFLNQFAPAMVVDADPNRSAINWAKRGRLPFPVVGEKEGFRIAPQYAHIVFDTKARLEDGDVEDVAKSSDLLILPSCPDAVSLDGLMTTINALKRLQVSSYKVLLTMIPPKPSRDGDDARSLLAENGVPTFQGQIRRFVAFQKAGLHGCLVQNVTDAHRADGWNDYERIGKEMLPNE
jgi:chromosome partitioning protein